MVIVAGLGIYTLVTNEPATLVIYTYPSLFGGADCGAPAWSTVFGAFESAHHVQIDVECPAGTLASTLLAQQNAPGADLVIGLDEITGPQADADHLLVPYAPPALGNVSPALVQELSPDDAVVPYEWGYLGIDYNASFANATDGAIAHLTFPDFVENASWARQLQIEDPSQDITGEEFLVWQVEVLSQRPPPGLAGVLEFRAPRDTSARPRLGDGLRGVHEPAAQPRLGRQLHDRPGVCGRERGRGPVQLDRGLVERDRVPVADDLRGWDRPRDAPPRPG